MKLAGWALSLAASSTIAACSASRATEVESAEASVSSESPRPPIEVVVAPFGFDGDWYQTGWTHVHDRVALRAIPTVDGLEVHIADAGDPFATDLTLEFRRDADGRTTVVPSAQWHSDRRSTGSSGPITDLRGFVQLQFDDWSRGKSLNCRFALLGTQRSETVMLSGAFLVWNREP